MTTYLRRGLLALSLTCVALVLPGLPAVAAGTTSVTATASIAGDTTTALTGSFQVWAAPFSQGGGYPLSAGSRTLDLADGDYKLGIQLDTMDGTTRYYKAGVPEGVVDRAAADVVTLDGTPFSVSLMFPQIAQLSGTVTNGDGDPMPGVFVGRNRLGSSTQRTTDSSGHYDFGYVQTGRTFVTVPGSGGWAGVMQAVTIPASGPVVADLVMRAPATLAGAVADAVSGAPLAGIEVAANLKVGSEFYTLGSATTDATGHWSVNGLQEGEFALGFSDPLEGYPRTYSGGAPSLSGATLIPTTAGQSATHDEQLTEIDKDMTDRSLSGVVSDGAGTPIAGIEASAVDATGTAVTGDTSDRSGRFAMDVADGTYTLRFTEGYWLQSNPSGEPWFPEFYPDAWRASDATQVVVAGDSHPNLDLALDRAGVLTTTVRGPGASTDLNAGYRVYAANGDLVAEDVPEVYDGAQLTVLVPRGTWKVLIMGRTPMDTNAVPLLSQWYGGGASLTSATALDFDPVTTLTGQPTTLPGKLKTTKAPHITGKPKVGKKLTVTKGTWNQMTGTTFSYTWLRGTKVVGHAASYVVKAGDRGKKLTAKVKATNGGLSTTVKKSVTVTR